MDNESTSKNPSVWRVILFYEVKQYMLNTCFQKKVASQALAKRIIVLHGKKFDKKIHVDESYKYAAKEWNQER